MDIQYGKTLILSGEFLNPEWDGLPASVDETYLGGEFDNIYEFLVDEFERRFAEMNRLYNKMYDYSDNTTVMNRVLSVMAKTDKPLLSWRGVDVIMPVKVIDINHDAEYSFWILVGRLAQLPDRRNKSPQDNEVVVYTENDVEKFYKQDASEAMISYGLYKSIQ